MIENIQEYWRKILTDNMIRSGSCAPAQNVGPPD